MIPCFHHRCLLCRFFPAGIIALVVLQLAAIVCRVHCGGVLNSIVSGQCRANCIQAHTNVFQQAYSGQRRPHLTNAHNHILEMKNCSSCMIPCDLPPLKLTDCMLHCKDVHCQRSCLFVDNLSNKAKCSIPSEDDQTCMRTCDALTSACSKMQCCIDGCSRNCELPSNSSFPVLENLEVKYPAGRRYPYMLWSQLVDIGETCDQCLAAIEFRSSENKLRENSFVGRWGYFDWTFLSGKPSLYNLHKGRWHEFRLVVVSATGRGQYSQPSEPFLYLKESPLNLNPPTGCRYETRHHDWTVMVSWNPPNTNQSSNLIMGLVGYEIRWYFNSSSSPPAPNTVDNVMRLGVSFNQFKIEDKMPAMFLTVELMAIYDIDDEIRHSEPSTFIIAPRNDRGRTGGSASQAPANNRSTKLSVRAVYFKNDRVHVLLDWTPHDQLSRLTWRLHHGCPEHCLSGTADHLKAPAELTSLCPDCKYSISRYSLSDSGDGAVPMERINVTIPVCDNIPVLGTERPSCDSDSSNAFNSMAPMLFGSSAEAVSSADSQTVAGARPEMFVHINRHLGRNNVRVNWRYWPLSKRNRNSSSRQLAGFRLLIFRKNSSETYFERRTFFQITVGEKVRHYFIEDLRSNVDYIISLIPLFKEKGAHGPARSLPFRIISQGNGHVVADNAGISQGRRAVLYAEIQIVVILCLYFISLWI